MEFRSIAALDGSGVLTAIAMGFAALASRLA
jgi:hypothetical protein